ncbi:lactonase family protein [Chryseobacterium sp. 09-1422]|uniref:Lactonase family protein n=1 Tax=Chryseobacterium kimseyorum TaxID=2984028 RepID=A0ABT3HTR9_9FLAO|nr:lactonase family protein [Chryseobacterium kimseyorum]MCW3167192.1 lactonase family protein [Chryseobacterium kimseyorum]
MQNCLKLLTILIFANVYSQQQFVFFGSYNWENNSEGIYVYQLENETGKLTKITSIKDVINPSYITISEDGKYIYASSESKIKNGGTVSSFRFNKEEKILKLLNSQKSGGENPVYVSVHKNGKWLVNGNYTYASVSVYPILEDGRIDSISQLLKFSEGSINPDRQAEAHIHSAVFSPDFKTIFFTDLGADKIRIYPFDNGDLKPLNVEKSRFIKTKPGSGPRHFILSKNGKWAYSIEEMAGEISVYDFTENTLREIQKIPTHPAKIKDGFESSDLHISPDGKFLYASNRGRENNIAIFKIQSDGTLETLGYQKTYGKHPRTFIIDETGKFVIVANTGSNRVVTFKRNPVTGLLKKTGKSLKITNVSCVKTKVYDTQKD